MPGLFEQFPHTNLHELNLDWIIDLLNQFKEELENSAVLSVNGQTGHVTLYESENVILPALPDGVNQWRLVRMMNDQYAGIMFYNGNVYLQRGNETMRLLTLADIPSSSGVVSWNGMTGVVNATGQDIPVSSSAGAWSIQRAIQEEGDARQEADEEIHTQINTEKQDRINADNSINNRLDDVAYRIIEASLVSVTIPDGTTENPVDIELDFSSVVPSNRSIWGAVISISTGSQVYYVLPWASYSWNQWMKIDRCIGRRIYIKNASTGWGNANIHASLFLN